MTGSFLAPLSGHPEDVYEKNFTFIAALVYCPWHSLQMRTLLLFADSRIVGILH